MKKQHNKPRTVTYAGSLPTSMHQTTINFLRQADLLGDIQIVTDNQVNHYNLIDAEDDTPMVRLALQAIFRQFTYGATQ